MSGSKAKDNYLLKNPININVVAVGGIGTKEPQGKYLHTFVPIGNVPKKVRGAIEAQDKATSKACLKEYYGQKWRKKLGMDKKRPEDLLKGQDNMNFQKFVQKLKSHANEDNSDSDNESGAEPNNQLRSMLHDGLGNMDKAGFGWFGKSGGQASEGEDDALNDDGENSPDPAGQSLMSQTGDLGGDMSFDDITITDEDLSVLEADKPTEGMTQEELIKKTNVTENIDLKTHFKEGGHTIVHDVHIYPEDKISEIKEKVQLITNIPIYRQYLFWYENGFLNNPYNLISTSLYEINIFKHFSRIDRAQVIFNTPIDKNLYNSRHDIKIEALDYFSTFDTIAPDDNQLYLIDLADFIEPHRLEMQQFLADNYQFELFYYGFVIKFWPIMTPEVFYDYINSERVLYQKYPMMAMSSQSLKYKYDYETRVIDNNYNLMGKIANIHAGKNPQIKMSVAITDVIITTAYGTNNLIDLRILFDKLVTSMAMPEVVAHINYEGRKYVLRKSYSLNKQKITFPAIFKTGLTIALRTTKNINYKDFIFVNIQENGMYYIKMDLNEEDELVFNDVCAIAKKHVDGTIDYINKFSREIAGAKLALIPLNKSTIYYHSINASVIWKHLLKTKAFKYIRSALELYVKSNIMSVKNYTQLRGYEIKFRKGIIDFDKELISKVLAAAKLEAIKNYYTFLSNGTFYQKWMQLYDGRIVFMQQRTTDVKFEVHNIKEYEFDIFHNYMTSLIIQLNEDAEFRRIESEGYIAEDKKNKKLRKLNEMDPALYKLKKYDVNKLYSIVCQNPRQPHIYTKEELAQMSERQKSRLVKYWNFTLNKPAYYGCPNTKYPHLSFLVGIHPKYYCLPCCGKRMTNIEGSKKQLINNICLTKHEFLPADLEANKKFLRGLQFKMRHVMNYGKAIEPGRSMRMPKNSNLRAIFYNTLDRENINYFLQGVNQHINSVQNIGAIFAISFLLEMPVNDIINELIKALKATPKLFNMIQNGQLFKYFGSLPELITAVERVFLRQGDDVEMAQYNLGDIWNKLIIEFCALVMGVHAFIVSDEKGNGHNLSFGVTNSVYDEVMRHGEPQRHLSYIFIFKQREMYYPVTISTDPNKILGRSDILTKVLDYKHPLVHNFYKLLNAYIRKTSRTNQPADLRLISQFCQKEYSVVKKLINMENMCYAVVIKNAKGGYIYLPINYSINIDDNIPADYEPFDIDSYSLYSADLLEFCAKFNKFIDEVNRASSGAMKKSNSAKGSQREKMPRLLHQYKYIIFIECRVFDEEKASGATPEEAANANISSSQNSRAIGLVDSNNYLYYLTDLRQDKLAELKKGNESLFESLFIKYIGYDPVAVNKLIYNRAPAIEDERQKMLGKSIYKNYQYQLFLTEFINYIENNKNMEIRKKLKDILSGKGANQGQPSGRSAGLSDLQMMVSLTLGAKYVEDANLINNQIANFYYKGKQAKSAVADIIDNNIYDFDLTKLRELHKKPKAEIVAELKKMVPNFAEEGQLPDDIKIENIYVPCEYKDQAQCQDKRLVVENIDRMIDLLADDILNPLKIKYMISGIFTSKIINYFKFEKNPGEVIVINTVA